MTRKEYMRAYYKVNRSKWARPPRQLELRLSYPKTQAQLERKRQVNRDSMKRMYEANPDKFRTRAKTWRASNLELDGERQKKYRRKRRHLMRTYINKYLKDRCKSDLNFRLRCRLRKRFRESVKREFRKGKMIELLGCSIPDLRLHLETRFEPEMSWNNYGTFWEIDHIMPLASFDLALPEHQYVAFHFSNLQPLTAVENQRKGAKTLCQS